MPIGNKEDSFNTRLLALIVYSSTDAIISKSLDGIVTSWNPAATKTFGYSAKEMIGRPLSILIPQNRADEMPIIIEKIKNGEKIEQYETVRRCKGGALIHVSLNVSPIFDNNGKIVGASKIARNITNVKLAEEALLLAQKQIQLQHSAVLHAGRLADLGQMAASLAHEINQPLNSIVNYLLAGKQLIEHDQLSDLDKVSHAISMATDQALRAVEIVSRIRDFAKHQEGRLRIEPLNSILDEAAALASVDAPHRGVSVRIEHGPGSNMVLADRIEIQQVVLNLIRNALDAMDGLGHRELMISTTKAENSIKVAVSDTGSGLDPTLRDRIFEPFVTTKKNGMGLGLAISRDIVKAHGGDFWFEARNEGGMVFQFTIPIAPVSPLPDY